MKVKKGKKVEKEPPMIPVGGKVLKKKTSSKTPLKVGGIDPRAQLEELFKLLECDHILKIDLGTEITKREAKDKWQFLLEHAFPDGVKCTFETWGKKHALLGIKVLDGALRTDIPHGNIVVGPEATDGDAVNVFHAIWGKTNCQLRRFQDGKIKESVQITNPFGPVYFTLAKVQLLFELHFPGAKLQVKQFEAKVLHDSFNANKEKEELRKVVDKFVSFLQEATQAGSLPLRQARAHCDCLHSGDPTHGHRVVNLSGSSSKIALDRSGFLIIKEKSDMSPKQTTPIDILLEITLKDRLSPKLFARMRMTYVLALKSLLQTNNLKCMVRQGADLILIYQKVLFRIRIQGPNSLVSTDPRNPWKLATLSEFINRIGNPNRSWAGLCTTIHAWSRNNGFEHAIPTTILDLVAASLYFDGGKIPPILDSSASMERSFLCFLHRLAFTDFKKTPIFLTAPEEFDVTAFNQKFVENRSSFPPVCIVTPFDVTPSCYTIDLDQVTLTRLVNYARKILHHFTSSLPDINYSKLLNTNLQSAFDITLTLKPLQVPSLRKSESNETSTSTQGPISFPIVGYDPVKSFIDEAKETFGKQANFYFNRPAHTIGIKMIGHSEVAQTDANVPKKPQFDPSLMVEDLKVLGRGLIKNCELNINIES